MSKILLFFLILVLFPTLAYAQLHSYGSAPELKGIIEGIKTATWIIFTLITIVMFVLAGILFLTAQGEAAKLATARSAVIWGFVGIIVGLIAFSAITFVSGLTS